MASVDGVVQGGVPCLLAVACIDVVEAVVQVAVELVRESPWGGARGVCGALWGVVD